MSDVAIAHLASEVAKAERAFTSKPNALWSDRTYLSRETTLHLREILGLLETCGFYKPEGKAP